MKTISEQQAALARTAFLLQFVPLGMMLGALAALIVSGEAWGPPLITLFIAWACWFVGMFATVALTLRNEAQLQLRLAAAADGGGGPAGAPGAPAWPTAAAILSRAMPARRRAAFRTALYVANTPDRGPIPVAVRLAPADPPPRFSGARLRLDPRDPAVAVIDPLATAEEHAAAATDPALAALDRAQRGLSLRTRSWLPWLGVGLGVGVVTAALLLALG